MNANGTISFTASVAVQAPIAQLLTYLVPVDLVDAVRPGQLVEVPLGKGRRRGVIAALESYLNEGLELKAIERILELRPLFERPLLETLLKAADYYLIAPGELFFTALPPVLRRQKLPGQQRQVAAVELVGENLRPEMRLGPKSRKIIDHLRQHSGPVALGKLEEHFTGARSIVKSLAAKNLVRIVQVPSAKEQAGAPILMSAEAAAITLTPAQQAALDRICAALEAGRTENFLLQGVTGSGKTEVYLRAIERALELGRGALLLVPEIALTPQLVSRVVAHLGDGVAVLHSGLSPLERATQWRKLWQRQARVAVGTRSAVFAPVGETGLIIVDEEHDSSYKQSETLPYHGRDLALLRGQRERAVVVLGSATPSAESYFRARQGKLHHLRLDQRVTGQPLPRVTISDLRSELSGTGPGGEIIGGELALAIAETLDRGEQAILFLNRRGFASFALCRQCGQSLRCPNCSVALVYHLRLKRLVCHYCGATAVVSESCPACGARRLELFGLGTEKCEEELSRRFPGARLLRLDADSANSRLRLQEILSRFASHQADILVGTQMVTKGHDIPGVTLVGVVLAELGLNLPDFRAFERTFQQLVQAAGRAGRGKQPGRVIIQTFLPEHPCLQAAAAQQVDTFLQEELMRRERAGFPPAGYSLMVRVSHPQQQAGRELVRRIFDLFLRYDGKQLRLLGPAPAPIERIAGRYRFQLLVLAAERRWLLYSARRVQAALPPSGGGRVVFDVDPQDML